MGASSIYMGFFPKLALPAVLARQSTGDPVSTAVSGTIFLSCKGTRVELGGLHIQEAIVYPQCRLIGPTCALPRFLR